MTAKDFLMRGYRLLETIESYEEEIKRLSDIMSGSGIGEKVQTSPAGDSIPKAVEKIEGYKKKLKEAIAHLVTVHEEINSVINLVPSADERLLLRLRYVNHYSWQDIAGKMRYCERHVKRLHDKALADIESRKNFEGISE